MKIEDIVNEVLSAPEEPVGAKSCISDLVSQFADLDLKDSVKVYIEQSTKLRSPYCMGHQVAIPSSYSMMADVLMAGTNNSTAIEEMGTSAIAAETYVLNWMLQKAGWANGEAVFTHGGSLANLTALLAARAACQPEAWKEGVKNLVLLAPTSSHYCVARSAGILGLGSHNVVGLATDSLGRIRVEDVLPLVSKVRREGRQIMALVANACSTATGQYDDLKSIGEICRDQNIWFHIDGAHGASALVSAKYKHSMEGSELADSMVWDTHKMLGTSALCAAVLFRKTGTKRTVFSQDAHYLDQPESEQPFTSVIECTKPAIGLRLFMNLKGMGEQGLQKHYDQLVDLALKAHDLIDKQPDFSSLCQPQTNIVCFQYKNRASEQIRQMVLERKKFYITQADINGATYLRLTFMNPKTEIAHIKELLEEIRSL